MANPSPVAAYTASTGAEVHAYLRRARARHKKEYDLPTRQVYYVPSTRQWIRVRPSGDGFILEVFQTCPCSA